MNIEQLKTRKNDFLKTMNEFKNIYDKLEYFDSLLKKRFEECPPFDDFAWKIFEKGIVEWIKEFFYEFRDKINIENELYYYIYELKWGKSSKGINLSGSHEYDDNYDIKYLDEKFYLTDLTSFWSYIIFCIENTK